MEIYKSSYPVYGSAGNIDMLSTEGFFLPSKRKGLLQHEVDNEVSALARLAFCENSLIGQLRDKCPLSALTGVRIKRVEQFRARNVGIRNNEVSVLSECP